MLRLRMRSYWLYILASRPRGTLYVGMTNDLVRRVQEHRDGLADGFTKEHNVKMLVYYEQHSTAIGAIQREKNYQTLVTQMENRSCYVDESRMAGPLGGDRALNQTIIPATSQHRPPGQARW
jgi:predicted GIY-YIG superfamily endonuclease